MYFLQLFDDVLIGSQPFTVKARKIELFKIITGDVLPQVSDFPVLPLLRTQFVLVLVVPNISLFLEQIDPKPNSICIIHSEVDSLILCFQTQTDADIFVIQSQGNLFSPGFPHLRIISLFLAAVSSSVIQMGSSAIFRKESNHVQLFPAEHKKIYGNQFICLFLPDLYPNVGISDHFEIDFQMPVCPICFQMFDQPLTSLFSLSLESDVSEESFQSWGCRFCPVCSIYFSDRTNLKCAQCNEVRDLWICMTCGHLGCGRNYHSHAFIHFNQTGHRFCLDLTKFLIWDYAKDDPVNRTFSSVSNTTNEMICSSFRNTFVDFLRIMNKEELELYQQNEKKSMMECARLQQILDEIESQEASLEKDFIYSLELEKKIEMLTSELNLVKSSPDFVALPKMEKRIKELEKQLDDINHQIENEYVLLESATDVSSKVIQT